jgi:hypothetical protein
MVSHWSFGFFKIKKVYPQTSFRWWNFLANYFLKNKAVSPTAVTTIAIEFAF